MTRAPLASTSTAPSPRTASLTSGCCPSGCAAEPQRRRVELHELQVGHLRAGAQRERDAVAGRDRRVGGAREDLAEPAGGEHDGAREHRADAVALPSPSTCRVRPATARARARGGPRSRSSTSGVLDDLDLGVGAHRGDERALDLEPGRVAAGVHDPVAGVAALAGQREVAAVGGAVEGSAQGRQLAHARPGPR